MRIKSKATCLRCDGEMKYAGIQEIQKGKASWVFDSLPNILEGAMKVEVFVCKHCGKIELYSVMEEDYR